MLLMIDEAHDFDDSWLRLATQMVSPATRSLLVLYDDAQSIYQPRRRAFNFASVGIEARGRTSILRLNYRNTAEVLALAMDCAQGLLGDGSSREEDQPQTVQPTTAGRHGPLPSLAWARDENAEARLVAERIAALLADGVPPNEVGVLLRTRSQMPAFEQALRRRQVPLQSMASQAFRRFDWAASSVKLLTMHSAKGLEFAHVFVAGLQVMPWKDETLDEALRLFYVAATRATLQLVLSGHGRDSALSRHVRQALERVTQRLSATPAP